MSKDEAKEYLVPALHAARDLAVRGGMHFHFLSELDHLIATAKANAANKGLCADPGGIIDLLAPKLCAVQPLHGPDGLDPCDMLSGLLATELCCAVDLS